jgi:KDO2-lipid IV(A) lauroyltransferase
MNLKKLRHSIIFPITGALCAVTMGVVPRLPLACVRWSASVLGRLVYAVPYCRNLVTANLEVAFPDWTPQQRRTVGRRSVQSFICTLGEFLWAWRDPKRLSDLVVCSQAPDDAYMAFVKNAPGSIAISPHIGNWELAHLSINASGVTTCTVAQRRKNPYLERMITAARTSGGSEIIHQHGAARKILQGLRGGKTLCLLVDQNTKPKYGGTFIECFGLPAAMSRAPAVIGRRVGADIRLVYCLRRPDGKLQMYARPLPRPAADYSSDEALLADINAATEAMIRANPEQYLWLYPRWKFIPPGLASGRERYPYYAEELEPAESTDAEDSE